MIFTQVEANFTQSHVGSYFQVLLQVAAQKQRVQRHKNSLLNGAH